MYRLSLEETLLKFSHRKAEDRNFYCLILFTIAPRAYYLQWHHFFSNVSSWPRSHRTRKWNHLEHIVVNWSVHTALQATSQDLPANLLQICFRENWTWLCVCVLFFFKQNHTHIHTYTIVHLILWVFGSVLHVGHTASLLLMNLLKTYEGAKENHFQQHREHVTFWARKLGADILPCWWENARHFVADACP